MRVDVLVAHVRDHPAHYSFIARERMAGPALVREAIRQWYASRWFAPNRLKSAALTDTVKGVYLPYWTFDAKAHADWAAESGYHYYTTETYTQNGQTRTRQVQHVRWEPAAGRRTALGAGALLLGLGAFALLLQG